MAIKKLNLNNVYKVYRISAKEIESKIKMNLEESIGSDINAHININSDNNYVAIYIEYKSDVVRTQTNSILRSLDLNIVSNTSTVKVPQKIKDALVNAGFIDPRYDIIANESKNGTVVYLNTDLTLEALLPNSEDGTQYINWRMVNDKNQRDRKFIEIAMAKNEYLNEVRQIVSNINNKKKNKKNNNNRRRNNRQRR